MSLVPIRPAGLPVDPLEPTEAQTTQQPVYVSALVAHVRACFDENKRARQEAGIDKRLIRNLRMYRSEYEPEKLAAIRKMKSPEIFIPIVNMKCRAAEAWLRETYTIATDVPWGLEPTPLPDIPDDEKQKIMADVQMMYQQLIEEQLMMQQMQGVPIDPYQVQQTVLSFADQAKYEVKRRIMQDAKKGAEIMQEKIDDQFTEGGFYKSLDECLHDITIFPTAVLKGPVYRKRKKLKKTYDEQLRTHNTEVYEEVTEHYYRVSPFDIYPSPESTGKNDGNIVERCRISKKDLFSLIGADGFNDAEIREVLRKNPTNSESIPTDSERIMAEDKVKPYTSESKYDMLEFWGPIEGKLLLEWGMDPSLVPDPFAYYDAAAWVIENHCIKAILNPDPLGGNPYSIGSYIDVPGSFWGIAPPDILNDLQGAINAIARATIYNSAVGSGPLVERNIDRLPQHEKDEASIYPWKLFDSTESQMGSNAPAIRFYQPPVVVDKLLLVTNHYMKMADELSGIPAYAHGDVTVGGAGRTASGLQMLTNNANRGIKVVVRNIDSGLITPTVERQYYLNLVLNAIDSPLPDMVPVAKGTAILEQREAEVIRKQEFLALVSNPVDQQITGMGGREYLLSEIAKANGLDEEAVLAGAKEQQEMWKMQMLQAMGSPGKQPTQQPSPQAPKRTNEAGKSLNGQEVR